MKRLERGSLYVITDSKAQKGRSHLEVLTEAVRGGASIVQLRDKEAPDEVLIDVGKALRKLCNRFNVLLIVNERIRVAKVIEADGLHIGQDDIPLAEAKKKLGRGVLLGISTHSLAQARRAVREGADYIGIGPIFETPTKPDYPPVGIEFIQQVRKEMQVPFVAIGGINSSNAKDVLAAGAYSIAVVRAVVGQKDVYGATQKLKTLLDSWRQSLETKNE